MTTYSSSVEDCCENKNYAGVPSPCCITNNRCINMSETNCNKINGVKCSSIPGPSPPSPPSPGPSPPSPGPSPPSPGPTTLKYLDFNELNNPKSYYNNLPNIQISKVTGMKSMDDILAKNVSEWHPYTCNPYIPDVGGLTVDAFCPPLVDTEKKVWYANIPPYQSKYLQNYNIFSPFINPTNTGDTSKGLGPFKLNSDSNPPVYSAIVSYNLDSGGSPAACSPPPTPPAGVPVSCQVNVIPKFNTQGGKFGPIQNGDFVFFTTIQSAQNWSGPGPGRILPADTYLLFIYNRNQPGNGKILLSGWKMLLQDSKSGPLTDNNGDFIGKDVSIDFALCNPTCPSINNCGECTPILSPGPSPGPTPPRPPSPDSITPCYNNLNIKKCFKCNGTTCSPDNEHGQFPMMTGPKKYLYCNDTCPLCSAWGVGHKGTPLRTCEEAKNHSEELTCSQLPSKDHYITQITSLGCTKDQAATQWNNFNSCLCGAAPVPPGKNPGKGLSVPVIIIISLAVLLVVGILLYLLFRK